MVNILIPITMTIAFLWGTPLLVQLVSRYQKDIKLIKQGYDPLSCYYFTRNNNL